MKTSARRAKKTWNEDFQDKVFTNEQIVLYYIEDISYVFGNE